MPEEAPTLSPGITAAHEWASFVGVACDGIDRPAPDDSVATATILFCGYHATVVAAAVGIKGVSPRAPSWG